MPIDPANDDLSAYLDGELPPEGRERVERALDRDPDLRAELRRLEKLRKVMLRHGRAEAPFGLAARVLEAVADEPVPRVSWWSRWRRPFGLPIEGLAVAAAALLVVVVVGARNRAEQPVDDDFSAPSAPLDQRTVQDSERDAAAMQRRRPDQRAEAQERDGVADAVIEPDPSEPSADLDGLQGTGEGGAGAGGLGARGTASKGEVAVATSGDGSPDGEPTPDANTTSTLSDDATPDSAPALFGASYRYRIEAAAPDALGRLVRLAGRYGGEVRDANGRLVQEPRDLSDVASFRVNVPANNLARFGSALRELGMVQEMPDARIFASSEVSVQVDLVPAGSEGVGGE